MTFSVRFPDAHILQEVLDLLFKAAEPGHCACCGATTFFLDYTYQPRAKPVCSEECLIKLVEQSHGKAMGKLEEYRRLNCEDAP